MTGSTCTVPAALGELQLLPGQNWTQSAEERRHDPNMTVLGAADNQEATFVSTHS